MPTAKPNKELRLNSLILYTGFRIVSDGHSLRKKVQTCWSFEFAYELYASSHQPRVFPKYFSKSFHYP